MATFDMTSKVTPGVGANVVGIPSTRDQGEYARAFQAILDIDHHIKAGNAFTAGDVFQLLKVPANTVITFGGAEVVRAFDGTTPTVDIDFAGGDDIIDDGDVSAVGYLAGGVNGQTNVVTTGAASTFTQFVETEDTIDVVLNAGANDVTTGLLRVYGFLAVLRPYGDAVPSLAPRDQLG